MINTLNPDFKNTPVSDNRPDYQYELKHSTLKPYVSIITAFYNTGKIFHQTAKSILNQSFQQWEWIIVNDCSSRDESKEILDKYRNIDKRIKVIDHTHNKGPGAARNTAIQNAASDYLLQLDSDNLIESTTIEKWLWYLESYKTFSFVKGYSVGFDKDEYLWDMGFHNEEQFLDSNLVDITSMLKKDVYQKVGGYDESIRDGFEDWDFWLKCAHNGYWGGTVPEYLDWYRRREDHSERWENWDEGAKQKEFRSKLKQKYAQLWDGKFPKLTVPAPVPNENISDKVPFENLLSKRKKRILFIVPWLTIGGSDKFTLDLASQLSLKDWELTIATTLENESVLLSEFAKLTPDIFLLPNFLKLIDFPRFLSYLIQSRSIDAVLFTQSEIGYLLLPYLRSVFPDIPFLDYCHIEEEYWKNGGYPTMSVKYGEFLDKQVVSSEHLKNWMIERGADENNIEVCYTNIDHNKWKTDVNARTRIRTKLLISENDKVILYAGRLVEQKQPNVFAQTIRKLSQDGCDFKIIVAGDGEFLPWLKKFAKENNIDKNIIFLGMVSNEYIKDLMSVSDIFFLPSKWEGIALSIYEAMSCGLVVVGANVGGQSELVTKECGFLVDRSVEATESENYAKILIKLINHPAMIIDMGQSGRKRIVDSFDIEHMGAQFDSLLNKLIDNTSEKKNRSVPSRSIGIILASNAIETIRLNELADSLWINGKGTNIKQNIFLFFKKYLDDTYCRLIDNGWNWLEPIKNKFKKMLIH